MRNQALHQQDKAWATPTGKPSVRRSHFGRLWIARLHRL